MAPATARNAVALFGLFALAFFALVYLISPDWYLRVITLHFFFDPPYVPPFGDLVAVMKSIECWQSGRETYFGTGPTTGGCGGFMYSPVWLRMGFLAKLVLPGGVAGMVLAVAFFLSLRWLPPARTRAGLVVMLLAAVSSACVFAVERANLDVLLFLMCLAGAALLGGTWLRRTLAYALFGAAALLKFYPIVLMFAAARERLPRLMTVAVALVLGVTVFLFVYGAELAMALRGVGALNTHWGPFTDRYGAQQLAAGLALLVTSDVAPTAAALLPGASPTDLPAPRWVTPLLVTMAVAGALWLRGRTDFVQRWQALTQAEADFLLAGAVVVAGCFFAGYNIAYRSIFLLLALPGLLALGALRSGTPGNPWLRWLPWAVVYNLWAPATQHLIQYLAKITGALSVGRTVITADWLMHELAWWWTMVAFIAVMLQYAAQSPALQSLRSAVGRR